VLPRRMSIEDFDARVFGTLLCRYLLWRMLVLKPGHLGLGSMHGCGTGGPGHRSALGTRAPKLIMGMGLRDNATAKGHGICLPLMG
jgi:hypothetical protein